MKRKFKEPWLAQLDELAEAPVTLTDNYGRYLDWFRGLRCPLRVLASHIKLGAIEHRGL